MEQIIVIQNFEFSFQTPLKINFTVEHFYDHVQFEPSTKNFYESKLFIIPLYVFNIIDKNRFGEKKALSRTSHKLFSI